MKQRLRRQTGAPAEASLKRHLRLQDEDEPETADDEPFYTTSPRDHRLVTGALHDFVTRASDGTVAEAVEGERLAGRERRQRWSETGLFEETLPAEGLPVKEQPLEIGGEIDVVPRREPHRADPRARERAFRGLEDLPRPQGTPASRPGPAA